MNISMIFFSRKKKQKGEIINDAFQKQQEDHCGSYGCSKGLVGGGAHHTRWDIAGPCEGFDFHSEQSSRELGESKKRSEEIRLTFKKLFFFPPSFCIENRLVKQSKT